KPASPAELLARGENALRQLRYVDALACYHEFLETGASQTPDVSYRLGLCHEGIGRLDDAVASYRQAIGGSPASAVTFASRLGMVRCLLRQEHAVEARLLLYPFLFDETRTRDLPQVFVTDAYYLVALALAR